MATTLLSIGQAWLWAGGAVALVFLTWGIDRVTDRARGSYVFRVLLVPGVVLLWPLVLGRWAALERGLDPGAAHRPPRALQDGLALVLAIAVPLAVFGALMLRTDGPTEAPAVRLEAPQ